MLPLEYDEWLRLIFWLFYSPLAFTLLTQLATVLRYTIGLFSVFHATGFRGCATQLLCQVSKAASKPEVLTPCPGDCVTTTKAAQLECAL